MLMGDLVYYLFSWFLLGVTRNRLCDVLVVMLCFEIHLLYVDGILRLSSCMFTLRSLLCNVGRMLIMHEFVILIGVLLTESSCSGTSFGVTPA